MKITQEEEVDRQTVLNIELEDSDLDPYLEMGYRKVAPRLRLPGFRPGKPPSGIVQQYLGKEALLNEVLDTMLPECTDKAIQENKFLFLQKLHCYGEVSIYNQMHLLLTI